jgi:hypothetical protein
MCRKKEMQERKGNGIEKERKKKETGGCTPASHSVNLGSKLE